MAPIANEDGRPLGRSLCSGRRDNLSDDDDPIRDSDSEGEDEDAEISGDDDDTEDEIEIPPDPAHEALMSQLRQENADLLRITAEQDVVLAEMQLRISEIQQATARRQQELDELRAARLIREEEARRKAEEERQGKGEGCPGCPGCPGCRPPETGKKGGDDDDKDGPNPVPIQTAESDLNKNDLDGKSDLDGNRRVGSTFSRPCPPLTSTTKTKNAKNASNDKSRANFNKDSDQFQRNMK